jgi:hypothetical protein
MRLIASNGSTERWCLAAVAVLLLAPVVVCGLWTMAAHVVGIQGEVPTAAVVFSGSVVALCGLLRGRYAIAAVVIASAMTATFVVSARWWVVLPLLLITGAASGLAFRRLVPQLPHSVDGMARRRRVVAGLWLLAAMVAVVQSNRMSVFMADPNAVGYSLMPGLEMIETHSCLTSYVHGASVAQAGLENPYDYDLIPPPEAAIDFSPFGRDRYNYPPPFLLLPRLILGLSHDYTVLRALWYVINVLTMMAVWAFAAHWLKGRARRQMVLLLPLFWISMPVQFTFQTGNFHIAAVFIAIGAMIAFHRQRVVIGGLLLAFATLAKLSPGLLALALLVRPNLRAAAWTAGFGALLALAVLPVFGVAPWQAFFSYHLPRVQSGEALPFLDDSVIEIANNFSVFGIPFKFQQLGFDVGWDLARTLGNVFSVVLIILAVVVGRRLGSTNRSHELLVWLTLLTLGGLRSPFAPPHALIGFLWILVILSAELRSRWQVAGFVVLWIGFNVFAPMEAVVPAIALSLLRQTILLAGLFWLALRKPVESAI